MLVLVCAKVIHKIMARRVLLLRRLAAELNVELHLRVIDAKPESRLVALLGYGISAAEEPLDSFTKQRLDELLYSGPLRGEPVVEFQHSKLPFTITIEQENGRRVAGEDATGCVVWPTAHATAAHLCQHVELVRGCRVLELGAGTGLVGLVASALGASEVILTDLPSALPLLQRNVARNEALCSKRVDVRELRWGAEACHGIGQFDVVVGCEVVYMHDEETCAALVATMTQLTAGGGVCFMSYEYRDGMMADVEFFDRVNEVFDVEVINLSEYGCGLEPGDDSRLLYIYRPKQPTLSGVEGT